MWSSVATLALWAATWAVFTHQSSLVLQLLYNLHPSWCVYYQAQSIFFVRGCFNRPNPDSIRAVLTLASTATAMTTLLCLVAMYWMARNLQVVWLTWLWIPLGSAILSLALALASYMNLVDLPNIVIHIGAATYISPLAFGLLTECAGIAALATLYLAAYFWRSKGRVGRESARAGAKVSADTAPTQRLPAP
jgi:hypothetical protein